MNIPKAEWYILPCCQRLSLSLTHTLKQLNGQHLSVGKEVTQHFMVSVETLEPSCQYSCEFEVCVLYCRFFWWWERGHQNINWLFAWISSWDEINLSKFRDIRQVFTLSCVLGLRDTGEGREKVLSSSLRWHFCVKPEDFLLVLVTCHACQILLWRYK